MYNFIQTMALICSVALATPAFSGQMVNSFGQLEMAAEKGDRMAQRQLASLYEGTHPKQAAFKVKIDYSKALLWYEKLAQQGDVRAQSKAGEYYYLGDKVPQNLDKALIWFLKIASSKHPAAQKIVGDVYRDKKSYKNAFNWYLKAAKQDYAPAYDALGKLYVNGTGAPKNMGKALNHFVKAEALDPKVLSPLSHRYMGDLYSKFHLPKDARRHYQIAAKYNDKDAIRELEVLRKREADITSLSYVSNQPSFSETMTAIAALIAVTSVIEEALDPSPPKRIYNHTSEGYQQCAQDAVRYRIAECSAGLLIFDGSGNPVDGLNIDCNKRAYECKGRLQFNRVPGYFYCEIGNPDNLSKQREDVIHGICGPQQR